MDRKWWTLIAVSVAIFMLLLDITVVNVALPDDPARRCTPPSQTSSGSSTPTRSRSPRLLLTSGSLADLLGPPAASSRRASSCSPAPPPSAGSPSTPLMLNLARAVQGVGGAMMFATSLALLAQAFHGRERGIAFGVFGAVTGAAVAVGPVLGGVITSGIGWEWIFFVNVPIGVARRAPHAHAGGGVARPQRHRRGLDRPRDVLRRRCSCSSTRSIAGQRSGLGLDRDPRHADRRRGTARRVPGRRAAASAGRCSTSRSSAAPRSAGRASWRSRCPARSSRCSSTSRSTSRTSSATAPLQAGLRFLPITLLSFIVAPIAGRLSVRVPVRLLLGGGLLLVGGGLLAMTAVDASSGWTVLIPGFVIAGAGIGMVNPPLASTAIGVVHHSRSGMASGINTTFRQVGIATGIAGLGAVFEHEVTRDTTAALARPWAGARDSGRRPRAARHGAPVRRSRTAAARPLPRDPRSARALLPRRLHRSLRRRSS